MAMKVVDYIVDFLINKGVTDVFGLPGGVVLDFLYALDRRKDKIQVHLNYHEQAAAFAACGYAQTTSRLGVAYATRGPGITNMVTAVADTYYDSIPVMFITAHASTQSIANMRIYAEQEMNPISLFSEITKYARRIDRLEDVGKELDRAYNLAVTGRKGPVVLDLLSSLWNQEIETGVNIATQAAGSINTALEKAKRPVLLIGDGVRRKDSVEKMRRLAENKQIPVLSSRFSQDIISDSAMYFGYIGSHATRYSNFILSKTDLIIALGNRMAFPVNSESFRPVIEKAQIIRIDIDKTEFLREIPGCQNFAVDVDDVLDKLVLLENGYYGAEDWLAVCNELKKYLWDCDTDFPVNFIAKILNSIESNTIIVSDVGNNEFWLSRAYTYAQATNRILYSKSFGALGCAIPKAIGAFYSSHKPVVCFVGDQGLQLNIQELEYIALHNLPIMIIVLNNFASGMIRDAESKKFAGQFVHTTLDSGYGMPDIQTLAEAYGIGYYILEQSSSLDFIMNFSEESPPLIIEMSISKEVLLSPVLPKVNPCQNLYPGIDRELYEYLEKL